MLHAMLFVMLSWLAPWHPPPDPGRHGAFTDCAGWTYQLTRSDLVWFERAMFCEAGNHTPGPEADASAWTMVQRFYLARNRHRSFGAFLTAWSQCIGYKWSSSGTKRTERDIVGWVDYVRGLSHEQIPLRSRWFVSRFMQNKIENRFPGWVEFLTCGYERHAPRGHVGPIYVGQRGAVVACNAYYRHGSTQGWSTNTVRVVPAKRESHPLIEALREQAGPPPHERFVVSQDRASSTR